MIMMFNYSWFFILKMDGYLLLLFTELNMLEKQKLMTTNSQTDHVTRVDQDHVKGKPYEKH